MFGGLENVRIFVSDNNEKQHKMTTLKDLEKQIKKQTKVLNKAKSIAKASYDNGQDDMVSTQLEVNIAMVILTALENTLETVRKYEAERILPHNNL